VLAENHYSTDPYWAPQSGMKNWPDLLPALPDEPLLTETGQETATAESGKEKVTWWQAFWYWLKTGQSLKDARNEDTEERMAAEKTPPTAARKPFVRRLRNPFDATIPLFFSLELPTGTSLKRVPRQTEWFKNVSSLPITSRLKMLFSFQGGEEGNGYQRAGYQGDWDRSRWNQPGPFSRAVHELPARERDHDTGRR
jgi:hypothetical protein